MNTGTDENAVFDFYIPGGNAQTEILVTFNEDEQISASKGALVFGENSLSMGEGISHEENTADIEINRAGIYQIAFHCRGEVNRGTALPETVNLRLYINGSAVEGAVTGHTFYSVCESASFGFNTVFSAEDRSTVQIVTDKGGYSFRNVMVSVVKIGE